jgi:hypothetical protein
MVFRSLVSANIHVAISALECKVPSRARIVAQSMSSFKSVTERCAAAKVTMDKICSAYVQNPNAQLIDLMLEGQRELERCGLGAYTIVHPSKTLTHPWKPRQINARDFVGASAGRRYLGRVVLPA